MSVLVQEFRESVNTLSIGIAASMRAHFMGADGFEAGTDVWGIAKKGLKNAPAASCPHPTRILPPHDRL